ncbi:carbohydrate kinase family protein [Cryptosporangium sp. NPDC048952]|uniref:carbohydrate kinase family protein n=1 Tax=Cryptosporangium sp. NPDC048952 TaxID=3363961 RepID=UPI0037249FBE
MDVIGVGALNLDHVVRGSSVGLPVARGTSGRVSASVVQPFVEVPPVLGGSAFNTISTLTATGLGLGYVGVVGANAAHVSRLAALGVDHRFVFRADGMTGTCVSVVEGPDRTLLIHPGANEAMADYIDRAVDYLASARIVHVTSFLDALTPVRMAPVIRAVRARGALISLDPGHEWATSPSPAVLDLVSQADYLFLNPTEFEALGPGPRTTVVKSREGATEIHNGTARFTPHEPLAPEQITNPTGAGDTFAAGYLSALASDHPSNAAAEGLALARRKLRGHPLNENGPVPHGTDPGKPGGGGGI